MVDPLRAAATLCLLLAPATQVPGSHPLNAEQAFTRVERIGPTNTERYFFVFSTSAGNFTIRQDGYTEIESPGVRRRHFNLKLGGPGRIELVYFLEVGGDLFLTYELSDQKAGWGYVVSLDQKAKTINTRWLASMNGYNLGPGLVDGGFGYFSSATTLIKLDLQNGTMVWEINDLEKQYSPPLLEFDLPRLQGDAVLFPEVNRGRVVKVDKKDGKIMRMNPEGVPSQKPGVALDPGCADDLLGTTPTGLRRINHASRASGID
jgi:hypothetical protein